MRTLGISLVVVAACGGDPVHHLADAPPGTDDAVVDSASDGTPPIDAFACTADGQACAGGLCCNGTCVAGAACCSPAQCGETTSACEANQCVDVATPLTQMKLELPCIAHTSATVCSVLAQSTASGIVQGTPGTTYDVTVRFRGLVEEKTYTSGCKEPTTTWMAGGADNGDGYNDYQLRISSPPQVYHFNAGASGIEKVVSVDFTKTFRMESGATITIFVDTKDGAEIQNVDATQQPITIPGVTQVTQPYDGQFLVMDIVSIAIDPIPVDAHIGGGVSGSALALNGSQFATVADTTSLQPAAMSLEAWTQFAAASGTYNTIWSKPYQVGDADSFAVWIEGSRMYAGAGVLTTAGTASLAYAPSAPWHHVAMTYAAGTTTVFLDGSTVACAPSSDPAYDAHALFLGGDLSNEAPSGPWNGALDEMRVWSTARTPDQIWADMHTHQIGASTSLVGEWTFDEGTGQTSADTSGSGNTATLGLSSAVEASDPTWTTSGVP